MLPSENNIKAELSHAYLHAVASRAGLGCEVAGRHTDGDGVDAVPRARERFAEESLLTRFTVEVQLKATSPEPSLDARRRYPFALDVAQYDRLRDIQTGQQQILVVLFLPSDERFWLVHTPESLVTRRCAYWASLRGAPARDNTTSRTVYLPQANLFSVEGLRALFARRSLGGWIDHEPEGIVGEPRRANQPN